VLTEAAEAVGVVAEAMTILDVVEEEAVVHGVAVVARRRSISKFPNASGRLELPRLVFVALLPHESASWSCSGSGRGGPVSPTTGTQTPLFQEALHLEAPGSRKP
jgi:hypothetical protein